MLGTVGCLKEGYALGYDKDGIHYIYLDRVEWLCRCGLAPYIPELQAEIDLLINSIDENGVCRAAVDENRLKGISTYSGQQLETDWKTETKKLCDIIFRVLLIMFCSNKGDRFMLNTFQKQIDFLLENAPVNILYRVKKEILKEAIDSPEMLELQAKI